LMVFSRDHTPKKTSNVPHAHPLVPGFPFENRAIP
jgi:hypothetical protein